jgi:tellurite resistance protein TerC
MSAETFLPWAGFTLLIVGMLAIDLGVVHRKAHVVGAREALLWTAIWILLALAFGAAIFAFAGTGKGVEYLTGYLIEKSLSVDNIFVFLMIFRYFGVPPLLQPKVLHWGIITALVLRLVFILAGVALLETFHWIIYVFGGLLIFTAIKMALQGERQIHPERNPVVQAFRRFFPVTNDFEGDRFFIRKGGILAATPLLIALLVVETTDVMFAIDSIPAIFAITHDPFIVYTANAFAILGLRALFFALASLMQWFAHLKEGLVVILLFVGVKMMMSDIYKIPTWTSLGIVATILLISIVVSTLLGKRTKVLAETARREQTPSSV